MDKDEETTANDQSIADSKAYVSGIFAAHHRSLPAATREKLGIVHGFIEKDSFTELYLFGDVELMGLLDVWLSSVDILHSVSPNDGSSACININYTMASKNPEFLDRFAMALRNVRCIDISDERGR